MAALALPALANVTALKGQQAPANVDRDEVVTDFTSLKPFTGIIQAPKLNREDAVIYQCGFETDAELAQWQVVDADGDGKNWVQESITYAHSGDYALISYSYQGGALTPDNWAISPNLPLGGTLTIWAENYSGYYPDTFAVYVCVGDPSNLDNFVKVSNDITPPASWTQYDIDLGAYSGKEGVFALRHYNSTDQFKILIDDISLTAPKAAMPQNVTVVPAATSADVTWENEGNVAWNLRYRQVNPKPETFWDFEDGALAPWTTVDNDGDGYTWGIWDPISLGYQPSEDGMIGNMCVTSASYAGGSALTPDNWLISPKVTINGPLSFWAAGQDPDYAEEVFAVYVLVGDDADPTNVNSFVKISEDITAESPIKQYTFDLADYQGQEGYVAIRHYSVTDMFRLNIDDIMIGEWAGETEWIYVNDINEMKYTIEGLTPETTYEVQVQGNDGEESKGLSSWTQSVEFTTLAAPEEAKFYVVGGFNGWNADTPLEITENGATFDVVEDPEDVESKEFKILTAGENDWLWLGGEDANGVGYFEVTDGMMTDGTEITLDDAGANFRLPGSGNYTITLVKDEEESKAPYEGVAIVVKQNNLTPTAVTDVNSKTVAGVKYVNIAGMESNVPFNGVNIVVTTYTDGTKAAAKVIK